MEDKQTGGPAFPVEFSSKFERGMTLRDYFAAKAMQSLIANSDKESAFEAELWVSNKAYEIADAMIKTRQG